MSKPIVLCFSGTDPCGGAGTQADIEAISSMACHGATIATALTVQNSQGVDSYQSVDANYLRAQSLSITNDMPIKAFKTGMLANHTLITTIADIISAHQDTPLVLDPVMSANTGGALSDDGYASCLRQQLLPLATIVTPNLPELYQLAPEAGNIAEACRQISKNGCAYVLVTGTHDDSDEVINRLFKYGELIDEQHWPRLPGEYHGSGCTLASSLAALLAKGVDILEAVRDAQDYTWHSLKAGQRLGKGQTHPDRFFWAKTGWSRD